MYHVSAQGIDECMPNVHYYYYYYYMKELNNSHEDWWKQDVLLGRLPAEIYAGCAICYGITDDQTDGPKAFH